MLIPFLCSSIALCAQVVSDVRAAKEAVDIKDKNRTAHTAFLCHELRNPLQVWASAIQPSLTFLLLVGAHQSIVGLVECCQGLVNEQQAAAAAAAEAWASAGLPSPAATAKQMVSPSPASPACSKPQPQQQPQQPQQQPKQRERSSTSDSLDSCPDKEQGKGQDGKDGQDRPIPDLDDCFSVPECLDLIQRNADMMSCSECWTGVLPFLRSLTLLSSSFLVVADVLFMNKCESNNMQIIVTQINLKEFLCRIIRTYR